MMISIVKGDSFQNLHGESEKLSKLPDPSEKLLYIFFKTLNCKLLKKLLWQKLFWLLSEQFQKLNFNAIIPLVSVKKDLYAVL